jgi:thioredoxin reductase (NADPH)
MSQAMEQGADMELDEVVAFADGPVKTVETAFGSKYEGKAVIIATGARPKELGLPGEEDYIGSGECFCAVCDGAFYAGRDVAVMGGGNAALQDAVMLAEKCRRVYLIHRRAEFRGEEQLVEKLRTLENVEFVLNSRVTRLHGDGTLTAVTVENTDGGNREIAVDGLFVCVGREPVNGLFSEYIQLDAGGYAASGEDCLTKTPGVFTAGDCRAKRVRQITTAAADGSVAALAACAYIDSLK